MPPDAQPAGPPQWADEFRPAFERAVLASERQRAAIMACFFAVCLLVSLASLLIPLGMSGDFRAAYVRALPMWLPFYVGATAYELALRAASGWYLRAGRQPPTLFRFANVAVEISLPTLVIAGASRTLDPVEALFLPPVLFYLVLILLTTLRLDWRMSLAAGLLAAGEYLGLVAVLTRGSHRPGLPAVLTEVTLQVDRAGVLALTGMAAAFVAARLRHQFTVAARSAEERNRAVSIFGQHVSPQVAERLLAQAIEVGPEVREVCVMFLDIRGFTRFSEGRGPEEVMGYLNDLFGPLIETINLNRGIINKFLGDGFMAVFGAPVADGESSRNAVRAAVAMLEQVERMAGAGTVPRTKIGIGLHAGRAVTGNVGSASRKEYTVIGDVVNLASRVEQLNKQFDSRLLITDAVWSALPASELERLNPTPLGAVPVKGQEAAVNLYRLA